MISELVVAGAVKMLQTTHGVATLDGWQDCVCGNKYNLLQNIILKSEVAKKAQRVEKFSCETILFLLLVVSNWKECATNRFFLAGKYLSTTIFPVIRHKLSSALVSWHPSDCSARLMLQPWVGVFSKGELDAFLINHIVPKLHLTLQEFAINPHQQHLGNYSRFSNENRFNVKRAIPPPLPIGNVECWMVLTSPLFYFESIIKSRKKHIVLIFKLVKKDTQLLTFYKNK